MRSQIRQELLLEIQKRMTQLVSRGYEVFLKPAASNETALFFQRIGIIESGFTLAARRGPAEIQVYRHPQGSVYVFYNPHARKDALEVGLEKFHGVV